jgi:hypothetical protein
LEIFLRVRFGFGHPLLYVADQTIGYRLAPNQRTRRFGNRIEINQYSMRSPECSTERSDDTLRILLVGDSIVNGGWWTDQDYTIAARMATHLRSNLPISGYGQVEVLNASANSWGPQNELAYLKKFGLFQAQILALVINTDDLFAIAPQSLQVGRDPNYPNRKPPLALAEVVHRYLFPSSAIPELEALHAKGGDRVGGNLDAIRQIRELTLEADAQMVLVMTPLLREVKSPGPRDYELQARQRLEEFTQVEQIAYLDVLPLFQAHDRPDNLYRDTIHLSPMGDEIVTVAIVGMLPL